MKVSAPGTSRSPYVRLPSSTGSTHTHPCPYVGPTSAADARAPGEPRVYPGRRDEGHGDRGRV